MSTNQVKIPEKGHHYLVRVSLEPGDTRSQGTRILQGLSIFFLGPLIFNGYRLVFSRNKEEECDTVVPLLYFKNVESLTRTKDNLLGEYGPHISLDQRTLDAGMSRYIISAPSIASLSITHLVFIQSGYQP